MPALGRPGQHVLHAPDLQLALTAARDQVEERRRARALPGWRRARRRPANRGGRTSRARARLDQRLADQGPLAAARPLRRRRCAHAQASTRLRGGRRPPARPRRTVTRRAVASGARRRRSCRRGRARRAGTVTCTGPRSSRDAGRRRAARRGGSAARRRPCDGRARPHVATRPPARGSATTPGCSRTRSPPSRATARRCWRWSRRARSARRATPVGEEVRRGGARAGSSAAGGRCRSRTPVDSGAR